MLEIVLTQCEYGASDVALPDGKPGKMLFLRDPASGILIRCPLTTEEAGLLSGMLSGPQVQVASAIPEALLRNGKQ